MPKLFALAAPLAVLALQGSFPAPAHAQEKTIPPTAGTCQDRMLALAQRASALVTMIQEHNRFAINHAEKYKIELQTCEIAKKANTRPQLEACLSLLDRAEQRAQLGNKAAAAISTESAALQAASGAHNNSCPAH